MNLKNFISFLKSKTLDNSQSPVKLDENQIKFIKIRRYKEQFRSPFSVITTVEYTKYGEPVLLVKPEDLSDDLIIYNMYINDENLFTRFQLNLIIESDVLQIADLQVLNKKYFRKGYGTLLLNEAIKLAKHRDLKKITGWMAYDNKEHHDRQIAFYRNNGFTILDDNLHFEMTIK